MSSIIGGQSIAVVCRAKSSLTSKSHVLISDVITIQLSNLLGMRSVKYWLPGVLW